MPKIRSLKINEHFRKVLRANRVHNNYFSIFFTKNFLTTDKSENILFISFITKKKLEMLLKGIE